MADQIGQVGQNLADQTCHVGQIRADQLADQLVDWMSSPYLKGGGQVLQLPFAVGFAAVVCTP